MNSAVKLGAFTVGLAGVFGVSFGAGQAFGPDLSEQPDRRIQIGPTDHGGHGGQGGPVQSPKTAPKNPISRADAPEGRFTSLVTGEDGKPVTAYGVAHDERTHLIVARNDLSGFRHLRPDGAPPVLSVTGVRRPR